MTSEAMAERTTVMEELIEAVARAINPYAWHPGCAHADSYQAYAKQTAKAALGVAIPAVLEMAAKVVDAEGQYRRRCEENAKNAQERRDFQTMKIAHVQSASAIRALGAQS